MRATLDGHGLDSRPARSLANLRGLVVEVGCGQGENFRHYPATVMDVVAIEPEARLRELAAREAERARVPIRVIAGSAERLPCPDAAFDAAIVGSVLSTAHDRDRALAEIRRVIRPGGELRFSEHARPPEARRALEHAGFVVEFLHARDHLACPRDRLVGPRLLGVARRPDG